MNGEKIMWQVPGTPKKRKDKMVIEGSMAKSLKKGDIIYFYVTHLPSESKINLSRIMLRGKIEDEPYPIKKSEFIGKFKDSSSENNSWVIAFSIGSITTLHKEKLEDNNYLSRQHLQKIDSNFDNPQGKRWLDKKIKNSLSDKIIKTLEESFKASGRKNDFEMLIDHFTKKCFFCDKYGSRNEHRTFTCRNGLEYFEYHHFIQKKEEKNQNLEDIIKSPSNLLCLCSNCHNKFHYGAIEEVNKMLEIVLEDDKIKEMIKKYDMERYIGKEKSIFKWLQEVYKVTEDM